MEHLELRETSFQRCVISCIIYGGWLVFSVSVVFSFFASPQYSLNSFFPYLLFLLFLPFIIWGLIGLVNTIQSYNTWLIISTDDIILKRGIREQHISASQITEYGCAGFVYRSSYLFFCNASQNDIIDFYNRNTHFAERFFGKERVTKLCTTQYGQWQLQVGVYVHAASKRKTNDTILIFRDARPAYLAEIHKVLHTMPILTGPILIDDPKPWIVK